MSNTKNLFEETVLEIGKKVHIYFLPNHVSHVSKKPYKYRIHVIWAPLLNRTPPIEYSNTTPVKNPILGQNLAKIWQIAAKFELNPTLKTILKNRTPGFK